MDGTTLRHDFLAWYLWGKVLLVDADIARGDLPAMLLLYKVHMETTRQDYPEVRGVSWSLEGGMHL